MARKVTFTVEVGEDKSANITTNNAGDFTLLELFGILKLCENAVIDAHNKEVDAQLKKSRKKLKP